MDATPASRKLGSSFLQRGTLAWQVLSGTYGLGPWLLAVAGEGPRLPLPPRPADASSGTAFVASVAELDRVERERRVVAEVARGNVPGFLRQLCPVTIGPAPERELPTVIVFASADYLAVGSDEDYCLMPVSPEAAQQAADLCGCVLPTPRIVDALYAAAPVKLEPRPLPPSPAMTTAACFLEHNLLVLTQRAATLATHPLGTLVAGHKKDVVLTPRLIAAPGKVAIYGWHQTNGRPIQPLHLGHTSAWVDYSHGARLIHRLAKVNGQDRPVADLLGDPQEAGLLSATGLACPVAYPVQGLLRTAAPQAASPSPVVSATATAPLPGHWQAGRSPGEEILSL